MASDDGVRREYVGPKIERYENLSEVVLKQQCYSAPYNGGNGTH